MHKGLNYFTNAVLVRLQDTFAVFKFNELHPDTVWQTGQFRDRQNINSNNKLVRQWFSGDIHITFA